MSTPQSLYRYQPLQHGVDQIRLLVRTEDASQPGWTFEHHNLDDDPGFYAISYRWEPKSLDSPSVIHVGKDVVEVSDNVIDLLRSLDHFGYDVPIWVDAVCIDQANENEKMRQIKLMKRIYSQASQVLVYLGDDPFARGEAGMRRVRSDTSSYESSFDLSEVLKVMYEMETGGPKSHLQFNRPLPTILIEHQERICHVLSQDWWSRLWTMQEYVLAKHLVFLYGETVIEDAILREYVDRYIELNLDEVEVLTSPLRFRMNQELQGGKFDFNIAVQHDALTALPELQLLRSNVSNQIQDGESQLKADLCVLTSSFSRQATIPNDKILGLLGILQSSMFESHVPVTSGMSHQQVFTSVARCVLTSHNGGENFVLFHYIDTLKRLDAAPSWVPNFDSRLRASALSPFTASNEFLYRSAPGPPVFETLSSGAIRVQGMIFDRIIDTIDHDTYSWNYGIPYGMHYSCGIQLKFEKACSQMAADAAALHSSNEKQLETAVLAYISTLVAGSRRQSTSYTRWTPTMHAYRKWMKRMATLAGPDWDLAHDSRNPGTANMDFLTGVSSNSNKAIEVGGEAEEFHQRFYEVCKGRLFFSTNRGSLGLGPTKTEKGDLIVLFRGGRTPFVLRESRQNANGTLVYRVVGEAYVHGIMDGEAFQAVDRADEETEPWGASVQTPAEVIWLELE